MSLANFATTGMVATHHANAAVRAVEPAEIWNRHILGHDTPSTFTAAYTAAERGTDWGTVERMIIAAHQASPSTPIREQLTFRNDDKTACRTQGTFYPAGEARDGGQRPTQPLTSNLEEVRSYGR
ncbi:hypothetical protein GCM10022200_05580 [Microbacterium awajiense]|uniref:Integrase n=1 Tax=Microbacterium awajiense TaxID=415214 RepID=A0ABP7A703_9MICO